VKSEADQNQTLLRVKISTTENYHRQAESLIVWQSEDESWHLQNLALSFQDKYGCTLTLSDITEAQKSLKEAAQVNNFLDQVLLPNESVKQISSSGKDVRNPIGKHSAQNYTEKYEGEHDDHQICYVCHQGGNLMRCDGCASFCHIHCLPTPLNSIPKGAWYCSSCIKKLPRNPTQHSPQPLQSAAPAQHQQQIQHQPHHSNRQTVRTSHQKNHRAVNNQTTASGGRSTVKTPPEGGKRGAPMKQSLAPSRHVSQLVNNEREMVSSGRSGMEKGEMKNGFGPEGPMEGDIDGDIDRGQFIRVFYSGHTLKADSKNLDHLFKRLFPSFPELKHTPFQIFYNDDDGEKINIIDEECFTIFMLSDIPKDLFIVPTTKH